MLKFTRKAHVHDDSWEQVGGRFDCQQIYQGHEHLLSLHTPALLIPKQTPPAQDHVSDNATTQLVLSTEASSVINKRNKILRVESMKAKRV